MTHIPESTIEQYESRIGVLLNRALSQGGESLLDLVDARLGVASRHLARVRDGDLPLAPAVRREIERSFSDAEELLEKRR